MLDKANTFQRLDKCTPVTAFWEVSFILVLVLHLEPLAEQAADLVFKGNVDHVCVHNHGHEFHEQEQLQVPVGEVHAGYAHEGACELFEGLAREHPHHFVKRKQHVNQVQNYWHYDDAHPNNLIVSVVANEVQVSISSCLQHSACFVTQILSPVFKESFEFEKVHNQKQIEPTV